GLPLPCVEGSKYCWRPPGPGGVRSPPTYIRQEFAGAPRPRMPGSRLLFVVATTRNNAEYEQRFTHDNRCIRGSTMRLKIPGTGVATLLAALLLQPAYATTVLQMSLEDLAARADRVFRGSVLSIEPGTVTVGGGELPTITYEL